MKILYATGTPPHKGYYLTRCDKKYVFHNRTRYPMAMYWNGDEWQSESDDDAFEEPGNYKPIHIPLEVYPEWCELDV